MRSIQRFLVRWENCIVLALILATHLAIYYFTGIRRGSDTSYYVTSSQYLREHAFNLVTLFQNVPHSVHYATTILFFSFGGPKIFPVLNVLLSFSALWLFSRLLKQLLPGNVFLRLSIFGFFLVNTEVVRWNYYLLSDGVLINLVLLTLFALLSNRPASSWMYLAVAPLLAFTRPTAVAFFIPILLYCLWSKARFKLLITLTTLVMCLGLRFQLGASQQYSPSFLRPFHVGLVTGHLIADPGFNYKIESPFVIDQSEITGRENTWELLSKFPFYSMEYLSKKAITYAFPVYPYFSTKHNLFNGIYFTVLYLWILIGSIWILSLFTQRKLNLKSNPHLPRLFLFVFTFAGFVVLHTFSILDSEARYLAPWIPMAILAGVSLIGLPQWNSR